MTGNRPNALEPAHEALDDAHSFWHEAERSYQHPRAFRRYVDALIQAARNVTFRLQAAKGDIPGFDSWYEDWQTWMRADPVMKWLHDSRTQVTKRGGLDARSTARVSLIYSYGEPATKTVELSPDLEVPMLLERATQDLPQELAANAMAEIDRRWIADGLPDIELPEALSDVIRVLSTVLIEAQLLIGGESPHAPEEVARSAAIPECMEWTDENRRIRVDPATGDLLVLETRSISELPHDVMEERAKRLGWTAEDLAAPTDAGDPFQLGEALVRLAKKTLVVDKFHTGLLWLHSPSGHWVTRMHVPRDRAEKYVFWRHVAEEVIESGFDGLVFIGEFWMAPLSEVAIGQYPDVANAARRGEQLVVVAADKSGATRAWATSFRRRLGRIVLDETHMEEGLLPPFLWPVFKAWGIDIDTTAFAAAFGEADIQQRLRLSARLVDRARVSLTPPKANLLDESAIKDALRTRTYLDNVDEVFVADELNGALIELARRREYPKMPLDLRPLAELFFVEVQLERLMRGKPVAWGVLFEARSDEQLIEDEATRRFEHSEEGWQFILDIAGAFRWFMMSELVVQYVDGPPVGPVARSAFGVRADGSWIPFEPRRLDPDANVVDELGARAMKYPGLLTISALNGGLADAQPHRPRRTASRDYMRQFGRELSAFQAVTLKSPLAGAPIDDD